MADLTVLQCALAHGDRIYTMPRPARHAQLIQAFDETYLDQGFLLSDGTYAGRHRAYQVARMADQILPRKPDGYDGPELFSEDLW